MDLSMTTGWFALAYAILCDKPSNKALQHFYCSPDERMCKKPKKKLKSERVICVLENSPELSLQRIAEEAECSVALVENVIINARRTLHLFTHDGHEVWEKKVLAKNKDNPSQHYSKIATDLGLDRQKVRKFLLMEVARCAKL